MYLRFFFLELYMGYSPFFFFFLLHGVSLIFERSVRKSGYEKLVQEWQRKGRGERDDASLHAYAPNLGCISRARRSMPQILLEAWRNFDSPRDLRYQPACTATGYPSPLSDKARPLFPIVLQFRWIYTRFGSTWEIEFFAGILITITRRALLESQRYWRSKICQRIILYENFQILGIFFFFLFRN